MTSLFYLVYLHLKMFVVVALLLVVVNTEASITSCPSYFDARTWICCNNVLQLRTGMNTECCGTRAYNSKNHFCCNQHIGPQLKSIVKAGYDGPVRCCAIKYKKDYEEEVYSIPYIASESICCNNRLDEKSDNIKLECCDKKLYSSSNQLCCKKRIHWKTAVDSKCCEKQEYNPSAKKCVNGKLSNLNICGHKYFDSKYKLCCDGVLHSRSEPTVKCCGQSVYSLAKQSCCGNVIIYDIENLSCCNGKYFHLSYEHCCDGSVRPRSYSCNVPYDHSSTSENSYGTTASGKGYSTTAPGSSGNEDNGYGNSGDTNTASDESNNEDKYTSGNNYGKSVKVRYSERFCEKKCPQRKAPMCNKKYENCCKGERYNAVTEICCKGVISDRGPRNTKCCGTQPYRPAVESCCGNKISPRDFHCCHGRDYDSKLFLCCDGKLRKAFPFGRCCGTHIYDSKLFFCKNGKMKTYKTKFCDGIVYNAKLKVCCGGSITSKFPCETKCCGQISYTPLLNDCVDGMLIDKVVVGDNNSCNETGCCGAGSPSKFAEFCGAKVYDSEKSVCCFNVGAYRTYPKTHFEFCCNGVPYQTSKYICCSKKLHKITDSELSCCGEQPFDSSTHKCCNAKASFVTFKRSKTLDDGEVNYCSF